MKNNFRMKNYKNLQIQYIWDIDINEYKQYNKCITDISNIDLNNIH